MFNIFTVIYVFYGLVMGIAPLFVKDLPLTIKGLSLLGFVTMLLTYYHILLLYLTLIIFMAIAILNCFHLHGKPNPKHLLVRGILSVILIVLYFQVVG